jgi:cytochrome c oxidase subunit 2
MVSTVEAVPEAAFHAWLDRPQGEEHEGEGRELLEKNGCLGCHSLDGSRKVGPTFKGIWGRNVTVVTGGAERTATVDEAYLKRSIREPAADVVKGYPSSMPPYPALSDKEIGDIVDFLKELK